MASKWRSAGCCGTNWSRKLAIRGAAGRRRLPAGSRHAAQAVAVAVAWLGGAAQHAHSADTRLDGFDFDCDSRMSLRAVKNRLHAGAQPGELLIELQQLGRAGAGALVR